MKFSLQAKFVMAFVGMGLTVLFVSSLVSYVSFQRLVSHKLEKELAGDAEEFAETVVYEDDVVRVLDHYEWEDVTDEYVVATDVHFETLKKSDNMEDLELQAVYDFEVVQVPQAVVLEIDGVKFMCVVSPVEVDDAVVAFILIAASLEKATGYEGILKESILYGLLFLVVFGAGSAYVFAGRMVRPVLSIREAVGDMDLGKLDRRIELVRGDSEVHRLVETLNRVFERLEKSYQEIDQFSSNVAHELLTPLTILRGNIEVALSLDREREEYVQVLSELLEETLHIIHIVDGLLLLARNGTSSLVLNKMPIQLISFCEEQARDWEAICQLKNQHLNLKAQGTCVVEGDRDLLSQLFLNLISNACKYSREGQEVEVDIQSNTGGVEIAIRDQGIGIPARDQERVFERFYRVGADRSRETGGAGLGLSICKMIVELHGGRIWLWSEVEAGTSVCVVLPISNATRGEM